MCGKEKNKCEKISLKPFLDPRRPLVSPMVDPLACPLARNENIDHLYTGTYGSSGTFDLLFEMIIDLKRSMDLR